MDKKTKKILWGGGLVALGFVVYKLVFKDKSSQVISGNVGNTNNSFPIYPNPLCNDDVEGGCPFDARVQRVQEYLNEQGSNLVEDGLFGTNTAAALEQYLLTISDEDYTAFGYNYVETANYITLAFYELI